MEGNYHCGPTRICAMVSAVWNIYKWSGEKRVKFLKVCYWKTESHWAVWKKKDHITEWSDIKLVDDIQFNNYEVKYPGKHNPSFTQWWTLN